MEIEEAGEDVWAYVVLAHSVTITISSREDDLQPSHSGGFLQH
jgi:hypothetical protein